MVQQFRLCGQLDVHHCGAEASLKRTGKSWSFHLEHRIFQFPAGFDFMHFSAFLSALFLILRKVDTKRAVFELQVGKLDKTLGGSTARLLRAKF